MRALVTGGAGFIGSNIVNQLLANGDEVLAVDCFTDYYGIEIKKQNLREAMRHRSFEFVGADLAICDIGPLLESIDVVFHEAAQPGVRLSWNSFPLYEERNILATYRLLEAARSQPRLRRLVYASSSSVYGNAASYPVHERMLPQPVSPYGVTKLAGEHLCTLYGVNWGVPTVSLRYFTVYGPGQRPDMATHRLIESSLTARPFPLFGTGSQVRDFTYVGDVVDANLAAVAADPSPGAVYNIAGGSSIAMSGLIALVEDLTGKPVPIDVLPEQPGDVHRTGGSLERAKSELGWEPRVPLRDGVAAQVEWQAGRLHKRIQRDLRA